VEERLNKRILHDLLSVLPIAGHTPGQAENCLPMAANQFIESGAVAVLGGGYKRGVSVWQHVGRRRCILAVHQIN
jgi:hypothetical protein